jgi:hypothetical protein
MNKINNKKSVDNTTNSEVDIYLYNNINIVPVIRYANANIDKFKIYGDNRGKSGIYH